MLGGVRIWDGVIRWIGEDSRRGFKLGICGIAGGWGLLGRSGRIGFVWATPLCDPSAAGWAGRGSFIK